MGGTFHRLLDLKALSSKRLCNIGMGKGGFNALGRLDNPLLHGVKGWEHFAIENEH